MKHDSDILKRIKSYFMRRRSSDEAYDFEREMERDAFLYEAMDGFEDMLTSDIQQSLDELDDKLDARSKRRGFIFTWQAAAIVFVILAGTTVFAILGSQEEEIESAATEEDMYYAPREGSRDFTDMDSQGEVVVADTATIPLEEEAPAEPPVEIAANDDADDVSRTVDEAVQKDVVTEREKAAKPKEIEEREADENLALGATKKAADTQFDMADAEPAASRLKQSATQTVQADQSVELNKTTSAEETAPAASPAGGMSSYNRYLKKNLQRSPGMPMGKVVLTFEFDRGGSPKNIKVENSLCTACDAEAIRLVAEGPKWDAEDRKERVTVTIDFEP